MSETFTTLGLFMAILTAQLGHDRFLRREAATTALGRMPPIAMLHLHVVQQSRDAEQAARARWIIGGFIRGNPDWMTERTRPTNYHRMPWIELESPGANRFYVQLAVDRGATNASPDWIAYRKATTIWVFDQYRAGMRPRHVVSHLDRMVAAEQRWIREYGARYGLKINGP